MANYASLWTSAFDKEFRQLSKFQSLQRRRLGLQIAGIQREHARRVKRVRVEIREAGTLIKQYEDEKEQRARHLLHTFSKVHKRRRATHNWITAHQRRTSSVDPSTTFEVEIGEEGAPWAGGRRRDSQQSDQSTWRRRSSTSSLQSFSTASRPSLGNVFEGKRVTLSPNLPRRHRDLSGSSRKLPPLGRRESGNQTQKGFSGFLKPWRTVAMSSEGTDQAEKNVEGEGSKEGEDYDIGEVRPRPHRVQGKGWGSESQGPVDHHHSQRQIFWTETFPFVYHSVGETVCPRYKLFLQYDDYQIQPQQKTRGKRPSVVSTVSTTSQSEAIPRLRTVGRAVNMARIFNSLSLGRPDITANNSDA